MTTRSIARLYETSAIAQAAIRDLEAAGFSNDDVSYMGNQTGGTADDTTTADRRGDTGADTGAATGATLGTVLGGGAGLLAGLGALAIPGVGPVVAAGWLIATLTGAGAGAAAGGLLGALTGAGFGEEHATTYAEGVRRGGHLVVVRATDARAMEAERILERHGPIDVASRSADWRAEGWTGGSAARMTTAGTGASGTLTGSGTGLGSGAGLTGAGLTGAGLTGTTSDGLGSRGPAPGLTEDLGSANDPTRRRRGDVA
ncbi:hypothetical protein [Falsiroseomonas sp. CW058]|uniref:hypothetical protein n=1 Tax=Falsiroseomonas sp. CW058 TaxID=3388664 RepID=UPI003D31F949